MINSFDGLQFERRQRMRFVLHSLAPYILVLGLFTVIFSLLPRNVVYWLTLPLLALLVWVATFGWRQAVSELIKALRRLERL